MKVLLSKKILLLLPLIMLTAIFYSDKFNIQKIDIFEINNTVPSSADVVIAGASSGGISAAIAAARQGVKVVLLEETDYIGGQTTSAGVTSMDGNKDWQYGLYLEFINNVRAHYSRLGKSISTCYWGGDNVCFEPHVGRKIFSDMIAKEPNITLLTQTTINSIEKSNTQIISLTTNHGHKINTKIVIDATEYGDIIMMTEQDYRIGNGTKQNPSSNACIQDITYLAVIKKYPQGVPSELKITASPPGYTPEVRSLFLKTINSNGLSTFNGNYPVNWNIHIGYRGMPDSTNPDNYDFSNPSRITKTGVNWANDYPRNAYVESPAIFLSTRYLTDRLYRQQINCEAKLRTIQFLYYMQTELGASNWAVANDEEYSTPYNTSTNSCPNIPDFLKPIEAHLPTIPYVRESARGIGLTTLTGKDIKREGYPPIAQTKQITSIAIGDYPNDLHNCRDKEHLELSLESRADITKGGAFQVPLTALISANTDGLIFAEKNLSQSRLANGATRLQPITMLTGQAAGTLAAIASRSNTTPKNVNYSLVQKALTEANSPLFPFLDVKPGSMGFSAIHVLAGLNIISGTSPTSFDPNAPLTRSQAAAILLKARYGGAYLPPVPATQRFADVPPTHWAYKWVNQLALDGISAGCGNNNFCPDSSLTRAEFSIFLLKAKLGNSYSPPLAKGIFVDVPLTHFAAPWIEDLKSRSITSGCSTNTFCPNDSLSRAQTAIFITKAFPDLSPTLTIPSPSPTTPPSLSPIPSPKPGDLNNDHKVDLLDFNLLISKFGNPYTILDFNAIVSNYGQ